MKTAAAPLVAIVMGVTGTGKSTVGVALAHKLGWEFLEGDDLHAPAARAKLSRGEALTDADRAPWLGRIRAAIATALSAKEPLVVACSALRASYRTELAVSPRVKFIFLSGSPELLRARLKQRKGHFASPALLESQLATLEIPSDVKALDVSGSVVELVQQARAALT